MRFMEGVLLDVLDSLGVQNKGFRMSSGRGQAPLVSKVPFVEVMGKLRADPKYGTKLSSHPWGAYLLFTNRNCPELRALVDLSVDLRSRNGDLVSAHCSVVFARVFRSSGEVVNCLSYEELMTVARETKYEDREEAVVDAS